MKGAVFWPWLPFMTAACMLPMPMSKPSKKGQVKQQQVKRAPVATTPVHPTCAQPVVEQDAAASANTYFRPDFVFESKTAEQVAMEVQEKFNKASRVGLKDFVVNRPWQRFVVVNKCFSV